MASELARRIAITGAGAVGAFGVGTGAFWGYLDADRRRFAPCSRYASPLPCAESVKPDLRRLLRSGHLSRASLVSQFAVAAVHLALEQAGIRSGKGSPRHDLGLVYGTSTGPAAVTQEIYDDLIERGSAGVKPRLFQESVYNAPASVVSIHFGLKGPVQVIASGSCAPSVLYQAQILLAHPEIRAVVALCSDELCEGIQSALRVLRWQAPAVRAGDTPSRPGRGALPSEGAAALLLERGDAARERKAPALAELAGASSTNDAWRLVHPAEDGRGLAVAMRDCLADAEAGPADVDLVLSASANTAVDDRLEAAALHAVFGDALPPTASVKAHVGYAMGAAAMLDVALAAEIIYRDRVPAPLDRDGLLAGGVASVLCSGIGLNGLFGASLVRRAAW